MCLLMYHFRPSQGDLKYFVFVGICLHRSHFSHLKNPFSSTGPFSGNLLGRVGLIISAIFFSLLLQGIMEPLGNIFPQTVNSFIVFHVLWSCSIFQK